MSHNDVIYSVTNVKLSLNELGDVITDDVISATLAQSEELLIVN